MSGTGSTEDNCLYCGARHVGVWCHRVKRVEYNPDGLTIKAIEFHPVQTVDPCFECETPFPPKGNVIGKEEW